MNPHRRRGRADLSPDDLRALARRARAPVDQDNDYRGVIRRPGPTDEPEQWRLWAAELAERRRRRGTFEYVSQGIGLGFALGAGGAGLWSDPSGPSDPRQPLVPGDRPPPPPPPPDPPPGGGGIQYKGGSGWERPDGGLAERSEQPDPLAEYRFRTLITDRVNSDGLTGTLNPRMLQASGAWTTTGAGTQLTGGGVGSPAGTLICDDFTRHTNCYSSVGITNSATGAFTVVRARVVAGNLTGYAARINGVNQEIVRYTNGVGVVLASEAQTCGLGDTLSIHAVGSALELRVNGAVRLTATDTNHTEGRVGIGSTVTGAGSPRYVNWTGGYWPLSY